MKRVALHIGHRFRLSADWRFRRRLSGDGWSGSETGVVVDVDESARRVTVRFDDEQCWHFPLSEAEIRLEPL